MEILIAVGQLIAGFAILILGGEFLVRSAVSIACRLEVNPVVIGLTIIAAGTSAPELLTSVLASLQGNPDIALGNVVGSNIFNILAILGFASILKPNRVGRTIAGFDWPMLSVICLVFLWLISDGSLSRMDGVSCLALLMIFFIASIKVARKFSLPSDQEELCKLKTPFHDILFLILGGGGLAGGAYVALLGGVSLGELAGLSERVIGITIISVGTGLPELATSAIAAIKGRDDLAVANVIGSNVMNTLAVAGGSATITALPANSKIIQHDTPFMSIATIAVLLIVVVGKNRINRTTGVALLFSYVAYIGFILAQT